MVIVCKNGGGGVEGGGSGERYLGEVGAVHLSGQRSRLKEQELWCRVMLVDSWG